MLRCMEFPDTPQRVCRNYQHRRSLCRRYHRFRPANQQYEITAIIDTADEITHLGRIRFEDASDIVLLYNILGSYIRMNDLDEADTVEEGGDQ